MAPVSAGVPSRACSVPSKPCLRARSPCNVSYTLMVGVVSTPLNYSALRASPLRGRRVRGVQLGQTAELSARSAWRKLFVRQIGRQTGCAKAPRSAAGPGGAVGLGRAVHDIRARSIRGRLSRGRFGARRIVGE